MTGSETVINFVVEARSPGKPWTTMWGSPGGSPEYEALARTQFDVCRGGHSGLEYRLVRRTAVITDEVLEDEELTQSELAVLESLCATSSNWTTPAVLLHRSGDRLGTMSPGALGRIITSLQRKGLARRRRGWSGATEYRATGKGFGAVGIRNAASRQHLLMDARERRHAARRSSSE
jgi:hypothetical protein